MFFELASAYPQFQAKLLVAPLDTGSDFRWVLISMGRRRALNHRTKSTFDNPIPYSKPYLEGHRDLVTTLIVRITRVTIWALGVINPITKSP